MKVLILGATGRTGKHVLNEALARGFEVNCLVRDSSKVGTQNNKLRLFEGNPTKLNDLSKAFKGCDYIINTLNISRKSDFPWSRLRTPKRFLSDTMKTIILLAEQESIKRVVVCSAWGVSETKDDTPFWFRWLIENSNIKAAYDDHTRQEKILSESTFPWVIVRPVGLMNGRKKQTIIESFKNHPKPGLTINRISVAHYLLDALTREPLMHRRPVISTI